MTRRLAALTPFLLAAVIVGCGSSSSNGTSASASNAAASSGGSASGAGAITLSESEFKITPVTPTVSDNGMITITVTNAGSITHALAVQTPSGVVKTGSIAPGATATLKVDATKAGRYTFFCPIDHHRQSGMQGVLVVGSAGGARGGSAAPATTTSSSSSNSGMGYAY
jgi:plastocyanin